MLFPDNFASPTSFYDLWLVLCYQHDHHTRRDTQTREVLPDHTLNTRSIVEPPPWPDQRAR